MKVKTESRRIDICQYYMFAHPLNMNISPPPPPSIVRDNNKYEWPSEVHSTPVEPNTGSKSYL